MKTLRIRQGILAALCALGDATERQREHLEVLNRQYGRSRLADHVKDIYLSRIEARLQDKYIGLFVEVFDALVEKTTLDIEEKKR